MMHKPAPDSPTAQWRPPNRAAHGRTQPTTTTTTKLTRYPSPHTKHTHSLNMKRILNLILFAAISLTAAAQPAYTHPWQGKRIAYFGDSITDPRVKAGTKKWWTMLSEWLQATSYCYAISGRQWNDIPRQAEALTTEHGQDVDAIIILMGTNDYIHSVPLGEWYNIEERDVVYTENRQQMTQRRKHRTLCINDTTFRGRINKAMKMIKDMFPTKQVVLLTPIHRAYFSSSPTNIQPDELYPNSIGLWVDSYVEAVKEAGNVWAVPVIDLNATSGLYPLADSHAQYFSRPDADRLHPNDAGYTRMARTIYCQLSALPCTLE